MNILIVEDEETLACAVAAILKQNGYVTDVVNDGLGAIQYARGMEYHLIILDVMLPTLDGFEVVRILRKNKVFTPILMLTARSSIQDKVMGLNLGADDYLTKPFDSEELLARVSALTRRKGEMMIDHVAFEDLRLDLRNSTLYCIEENVQLTRKEFEVLRLLMSNPSMTYSNDLLIGNIWGFDSDITDNNVAVYISMLRKKLHYLHSCVSIVNIQGIGYRLGVRKQDD